MSSQKQNIVIFSFLIMSFIPFMLLTDFFPFMRFGMFSETIKESSQTETFVIYILKEDGTKENLSKRQGAMDDSHLNYLSRMYYYNNNIVYVGEHLYHSGLLNNNEQLFIIKNSLLNSQLKSQIIFKK